MTQILRLKHKLAALQRSAEELFVCCYGIKQYAFLCCDVTYPHIANIFLGGNTNLCLTFRLKSSSYFWGGIAGLLFPHR